MQALFIDSLSQNLHEALLVQGVTKDKRVYHLGMFLKVF